MNKEYWSEVIKRLDLTPEGAWLVYLSGAVFNMKVYFSRNKAIILDGK